MSITSYREPYKIEGKFQFPEYYEFLQKAFASVWRPEEVSMSTDVTDWQEASGGEREKDLRLLDRGTVTESQTGPAPRPLEKYNIMDYSSGNYFIERSTGKPPFSRSAEHWEVPTDL